MNRGWWYWNKELVFIWTCIAGVIALIIVAGISMHRQTVQCEAGGGHIEERNCFTTYMAVSCGKDCTTWTPVENCDRVCVGAQPEAIP